MSEQANGRTNGATGQRILVAVRDVGEKTHGQASLIDDVGKAERIVEALVAEGVEPEAVSALRATEVPLTISYRWTVEISEGEKRRAKAKQPEASKPEEGASLSRAAGLLHEIMPETPFQLRFDRVLWVGLWAVSLLVLAITLVTALSRGSAREFVIGSAPSSFRGEFQDPESALESLGESADASPVVGGATQGLSCLQEPFNACQCQDFETQGEAQAIFSIYPPQPGHDIDPDRDGVFCEWLPATRPPGG